MLQTKGLSMQPALLAERVQRGQEQGRELRGVRRRVAEARMCVSMARGTAEKKC